MAGKLDEISIAIGKLQAQFEASEKNRVERNRTVDDQFNTISSKIEAVDTKVDAVASSIDAKVEKASQKYIGGALGGALIVAVQYAASALGFHFPRIG